MIKLNVAEAIPAAVPKRPCSIERASCAICPMGRISAHQFSKTDRDVEAADGTTINNGYSKEAFGIVHVRTDGERVLIATHSGKPGQKESYVFHVDDHGAVTFDEEPRIR